MTARLKFAIVLVAMAVALLSLLLFYLPEHWLRQVNFASVTVDGGPTQAEIYIGHTTTNEAGAFLLVTVPGEGSFLFNMLDEDFRKLSSHEFVRLYRGAIILKPMSEGPWVPPLPSINVNEFRVLSSNGHTVIVTM